MALTYEKTWNLGELVLPAQANGISWHEQAMFFIKEQLVSLGSNPWTVQYSSDASIAGVAGDGIDRWLTVGDLNWGGTTRSWIVLRNVTGKEILLDLQGANATRMRAYCSYSAGFTGGATNSRPTATDEQQIIDSALSSNDFWSGNVNAAATHPGGVVYVHQSEDGLISRVYFLYASFCASFWRFEHTVNQQPGIDESYFVAMHARNSSSPGDFTSPNNAGDGAIGFVNSSNMANPAGFGWSQAAISSDGLRGTSLADITYRDTRFTPPQQILFHQWVYGIDGPTGRYGRCADVWWSPNPPANTGNTAQESPNNREAAQYGHFLTFHDGTTFTTA